MERHQDIEDVFERMSNVAPEILTRKKFQELTGGPCVRKDPCQPG